MNDMNKLLYFLLGILIPAGILDAQTAQLSVLHYDAPAAEWTDALPVGNGSLGAMIFGGVSRERIQFNEESLITGDSVAVGSYQPFGNVSVSFPHETYSEYYRGLDIERAVHTVRYTSSGIAFSRECFASYPDGVVVCRVKADRSGAVSVRIGLSDEHGAEPVISGNKIMAAGFLKENGMCYESQLLVLQKGGKLLSSDSCIEVSGANEVILLLAADTDFSWNRQSRFRTEHPHKQLTARLDKASALGYNRLLKRHLKDYRSLFSRVRLQLPADGKENRTTQERLDACRKGNTDIQLEGLLFQYGRYLLISSSRPGSLPANLQGIWNNEKKPAWYSQYTTDINIEMNYWLTGPTALPECHEPYFDWLEIMAQVQKERGTRDTALATGKGKGWINYSTSNFMGGASTWGVNHPGSAWMSRHFWEHYAFEGEREYLLSRAYPLLKDLVEYWEEELVFAPDGKHLITPGGWSPEHGPGRKEADRTLYPGIAYDMQIVYDLFSNYIEAAEVLGLDVSYVRHIRHVRSQLLPPRIGKWGQLQEWMEDWDDPKDNHRHFSHLFAVYPGKQISPYLSPDLSDAAYVSLKARGDISTGWSTAWRICVYARLLKAERAHDFICILFTKSILNNMFDTYPPFQIDGNFGYTAGVAEMLLQSHLKEGGCYMYCLLPALPRAWKEGKAEGLQARGGCTVSQEWKNGVLTKATFQATRDVEFFVVYRDKKERVKLKKGKRYSFPAGR